MIRDLRYILKSLIRSPAFALTVVLTLALGVGSAAAVFSVVQSVLFRSGSFSKQLVLVGYKDKQGVFSPVRADLEIQGYRQIDHVFSRVALGNSAAVNVALRGSLTSATVMDVSPQLFQMIPLSLARGRAFLPQEQRDDNVILTTHQFAVQHFGSAANALGQVLTVGENSCTVIGVFSANQAMPVYFTGDLYRPLTYKVDPTMPWAPQLFMLGELEPGISVEQAERALSSAKFDIPPMLTSFFADRRPSLWTMHDAQKVLRPEIHWVLLGAVGFLWAISCLNATNLMMIRALGRRRELSIRLAMGAGRGQLVRLVILESFALSSFAASLGIVFANWFIPLFRMISDPAYQFSLTKWQVDWPAAVILVALTFITSISIASVPALRIVKYNKLQDGLKEGGAVRGESLNLRRLRGGVIVVQAALSVILLTGAGLMVNTFHRLQSVPLGFATDHRVKIQVAFPSSYPTAPQQRLAAIKRLKEHLQLVPGVQSISYGTDPLLPGHYFGGSPVLLPDGSQLNVSIQTVSSDFFATAGIPIKRGRLANPAAGGEIMINEAFAKARFPNQEPVGQVIKLAGAGGAAAWLIVGVVSDLRDNIRSPSGFHIYGSENWFPAVISTFIILTGNEPDGAMISKLKQAVYSFDPGIVTSSATAFRDLRDKLILFERFAVAVLNSLSIMAVILTLVGTFSLLTYSVDCRMPEFGVRIALGATPGNLANEVISRGMLLTAMGLVLGVAGALSLTTYLQSILYETAARDLNVLILVVISLGLASGLACALPALRASKADANKLLRAE